MKTHVKDLQSVQRAATLGKSAVGNTEHFDVVVVGAGISGVGGAYHLAKQCSGTSFLRDGTADASRKPGRPGRAQSGAGRQRGNHRFTAAGGAGHGQHRNPVYDRQEQGAYTGHFESTCYHPLLLFNGQGDCLAVKLRPGNVHSAEEWEELLLPEIDRQQAQGKEVAFRGDAAFAKPVVYESVEEREAKYAIRLPANDNLERKISELLTRPVGRPSYKPVVRYKSFHY
jgi:glycine/D-amino acid oxidase-like deaminating enzyme